MARKSSKRTRLRCITAALVVVVAAACGLLSWEDKHGELDLDVGGPGITQILTSLVDHLSPDPSHPDIPVGAALSGAQIEVHFLDVGQAESILIKAPDAHVLIDAGENHQGEDVLRYLAQQGVRDLDYVIGTHPHSDHIGGLDTVIKGIDVHTVIMPEIPEAIVPTTRTYTDVLLAVEEAGLQVTPASPGTIYDLGDGAQLEILGPIAEYTDLNNMSVVARLQYGKTSFLFTGDACVGAENDLLQAGRTLQSDVLSVGHHGSNTSTSEAWLQAVAPQMGVISCGMDNSYGHPHREVMERFKLFQIRVLRTDLQGTVVIVSNGEQLTVTTEH